MAFSGDPQAPADGWARVREWLNEATFAGRDAGPVPEDIRDLVRSWGLDLPEDPARACLDLQALIWPLADTTRPDRIPEGSIPDPPPPACLWTEDQIRGIRRVLAVPGCPGLPELAWLLQRSGRPFPEPVFDDLIRALDDAPQDWRLIDGLLPPRATWLATHHPALRVLDPFGPPSADIRPGWPLAAYLDRWTRKSPEAASQWIIREAGRLPSSLAKDWLEAGGTGIPPDVIPAIEAFQAAHGQVADAWALRARAGDTGLIRSVAERVRPMVSIRDGNLHLDLPPSGPAWLWPGMPWIPSGFRRKAAFCSLVACLPPGAWPEWTLWPFDTFVAAAFRSSDAGLWAEALQAQAVTFMEPGLSLAWLENRFNHPDLKVPGLETSLTRDLPSSRLAPVVETAIRNDRYRIFLDSPVGRALLSPGLYWTAGLQDAVLQALQVRPALAWEGAGHEPFVRALAWRGHLGSWLRRFRSGGVRGDIPEPLANRMPEVRDIIQMRKTLVDLLPPASPE